MTRREIIIETLYPIWYTLRNWKDVLIVLTFSCLIIVLVLALLWLAK